ncbi:50S ribosomal protein L24 [Rubrivirga marina]|uniref:Large ribosomal subunit protein uL24 n=1 Tax=Rubrivirga marina TaxID=1196024 RepID=A0A271J0L6_9BACT|nr:50S ribosomal protein L24 [Rubrivirga marina]PAP76857.1 50S ribosomal protein L24 [Rubrivirga marina]
MPRTTNKQKKLHVKKGDTVALTKRITAHGGGQNDRPKGYQARVLEVYPEKQTVLVEGVNLRLKHTKPNQTYPNGGRIEAERPIHVSNVMPTDGNGAPTRIGRKRVEDPNTGKARWVRYAKTTGEELDS